jgi:hypothetical protein
MGAAVEDHDRLVAAYYAQRRRLGQQAGPDLWSVTAPRFTADPRRPLDEALQAVAEYLEPDDVFLDVGGGAGRLSLPFASRCREIVNIEPSAGMGEAFEASARDAGITNARWIKADWPEVGDLTGDIALVAHVTYFVPRIQPFIARLQAACRRRVIIMIASTPPPNQASRLYRIVHGEDQAPVPGHTELLPVLWERGILPDVRVLWNASAQRLTANSAQQPFATQDEAIDSVFADPILQASAPAEARRRVGAAFDELFEPVDGGFRARLGPAARLVLITWPTHP